jgi:hypothetical protein
MRKFGVWAPAYSPTEFRTNNKGELLPWLGGRISCSVAEPQSVGAGLPLPEGTPRGAPTKARKMFAGKTRNYGIAMQSPAVEVFGSATLDPFSLDKASSPAF